MVLKILIENLFTYFETVTTVTLWIINVIYAIVLFKCVKATRAQFGHEHGKKSKLSLKV